MKIMKFLLFIIIGVCTKNTFGLLSGNRARLPSSRITTGIPSVRSSTARQLIDPVALDTMQNTADIATNTFFTSFLARTIGTIVGNLLAAVVFKYVTDAIFQKREEDKKIAEAPPPVATVISQSAWIKLIFCIMIDLGSDASFLLPGIGEIEDLAWAPASAYLLKLLFESNVVSTLEFAKEILPGTDVLPLATIAWVLQNVFTDSPLTGALGLTKKVESTASEVKDEKRESVSPEMDAWDNKMRNKL
jgi:hypothetical protein